MARLTRERMADPAAEMRARRSASTRRSCARWRRDGNPVKPQDHAWIEFWRRTGGHGGSDRAKAPDLDRALRDRRTRDRQGSWAPLPITRRAVDDRRLALPGDRLRRTATGCRVVMSTAHPGAGRQNDKIRSRLVRPPRRKAAFSRSADVLAAGIY